MKRQPPSFTLVSGKLCVLRPVPCKVSMETIRAMFAMEDDQTSRARISHLTCLSINTVRFYLDNRKQIEEALMREAVFVPGKVQYFREDGSIAAEFDIALTEYKPAVDGGKVG